MGTLPNRIEIFETSLRDGFQAEKRGLIPTAQKIELANMLLRAGFRQIEVTSFASPKWIPQLADAADVCAGIEKVPGVRYSALVPNLRAIQRAVDAGVREVTTVCSASESHSKNNQNATTDEVLAGIAEIAKFAKENGVTLRGSIATAFGCPFEGHVPYEKVVRIALEMERLGTSVIALGDTTGMADPESVRFLCGLLLEKLTTAKLSLHFHQAGGMEFANVYAGLMSGITIYDSSVGGLGGCPYAPDSLGNIRTETLLEMCERMGIETGINKKLARAAGDFASKLVWTSREIE